jgi:preprotein translocase subunit SecB
LRPHRARVSARAKLIRSASIPPNPKDNTPMANTEKGKSKPVAADNSASGAAAGQPSGMHIQVLGQYVKDLSFENPNVGKLNVKEGENPGITLEVNVDAQKMGSDVYESAIQFNATAAHSGGTIYILELSYGGLFKLENVPPQALEPFLLINCPTLLFPFLRRIVADTTREGGYPPLLLDPFDFGQLYMRRQQELAQSVEKKQ